MRSSTARWARIPISPSSRSPTCDESSPSRPRKVPPLPRSVQVTLAVPNPMPEVCMRSLTQDLRDLRLTGMPEALDAWHAIPDNADRGADACLAYLLDAHRQA